MSQTRRQKERAAAVTAGGSRFRTVVFTAMALLAVVGLADAIFLTVAHFTGATAVCGGSSGCSAVLTSQYGKIGPVPLAAFGVAGYFTVFALATFSAFGRVAAEKLLRPLVWLMFGGTLWLLFVQAVLLKSYCRYCLLSAAITFLIAGLLVALPRRES